jgi:hypothetical protein
MGIAEVTLRQLAPSVRNLGAGSMDSTTSPPSNNSTTSVGQVRFLPHPPTLLSAFGSFGRGLDLAIGSLGFRVGTEGSFRLSDLIYSGSSAEGSASATTTSTSSIGSTSEVNLTPRIRSNVGSVASLGDLADLVSGVSVGSDSDTSSYRVLQIAKLKNVISNESSGDSTNSGIRKFDSYPDFCTNKQYLAHL